MARKYKKKRARKKSSATAEKVEDEAIRHYNIRDARENISRLVSRVDHSLVAFTLGRRNEPNALLVSYDRFKPLLRDDQRSKHAFVIVDHLMKDAPLHIRQPQIDELSRLPRSDLLILLGIEKLPMSKARQKELEEELENPQALKRLLRRFQIARAISEAREEGLYEAAEHLTTKVETENGESSEDLVTPGAAE